MKGLRLLGIALLLLATPTLAEHVPYSGDDYGTDVYLFNPSAIAWMAGAGEIRGQLVAIHPERGIIVVKSEVLGFAGPMEKDIAFLMDDRTTLRICWDGNCDAGKAIQGLERMKDFNYAEAENLSIVGKEVALYFDRENPEVLSLVEVNLPTPNYYFTPSDYVSPF